MVWARLDDNWSEREDILALPLDQRWHLLGMILYCCRNNLWDGEVRAIDARRASDVDDPRAILDALTSAGHLEPIDGGYRVSDIAAHVPSEAVRERLRKDRLRKQRARAHAKGDHSFCDGQCEGSSASPAQEPVPARPVPPRPGTPQDDSTGQSAGQSAAANHQAPPMEGFEWDADEDAWVHPMTGAVIDA